MDTHTSYMRICSIFVQDSIVVSIKISAVSGLLWLLVLMFLLSLSCCLHPKSLSQERSDWIPRLCLWTADVWGTHIAFLMSPLLFGAIYVKQTQWFEVVGLVCLWVWACVPFTTTSLSGLKRRKISHKLFLSCTTYWIEHVNCFLEY